MLSNPKSLHLHQLEEACKDLEISPAAWEVLKTLYEAMAKDHATYILSVFQEMFSVVAGGKLVSVIDGSEEFQQRIAREYTTQ